MASGLVTRLDVEGANRVRDVLPCAMLLVNANLTLILLDSSSDAPLDAVRPCIQPVEGPRESLCS